MRRRRKEAVPKHDFLSLFRRELACIATRRTKVDQPKAPLKQIDDAKLDESSFKSAGNAWDFNLVGLALSGGGIRSAAFNLGILQALSHHDLLVSCDYLSTVSGGGYIGGCLTSLVSSTNNSARATTFPLGRFTGDHRTGDERTEVKHVRRRSSYLAANPGLLTVDTWRAVSAYCLGLTLTSLAWASILAAIVSLSILIASLVSDKTMSDFSAGSPWAVLIVGALINAQASMPLGIGGSMNYESPTRESLTIALASYGPLITSGLLLFVWLMTGIWHARNSDVRDASLESRRTREHRLATLLGLTVILLVLGLLPTALAVLEPRGLGVLLSAAAIIGCLLLVTSINPSLRLVQRLVVPSVVVFLFAVLALIGIWVFRYQPLWIFLGSAIVMVFLAFVVDINQASLFYFYRDRLSEAFIIQSEADPPVSNDSLLLSDVAASLRGWPYHLINTTINFPGSSTADALGRPADFFVLSPLFCGSQATGYVATSHFEGNSLTLAGAMAISGAAANPQYGLRTNRSLALLIGVINARLGVWVENPAKCTGTRPRMIFWPFYLLMDLSSRTPAGRFVNLSDGGHIDNLGVYELLRRHCRVIIASDAGADPQRLFGDLGNLIATARVRLGIRIDIDVEALKPERHSNSSRQHMVVGTIHYPAGQKNTNRGVLIYIKPTLLRNNAVDLHSYRERHPTFPHETTTNQFFGEAQFEAYRELGFCSGSAAAHALDSSLSDKPISPTDIDDEW